MKMRQIERSKPYIRDKRGSGGCAYRRSNVHTTAKANIASCLFDELPSIRMARFASATQSSLSISQEGGLSWEIEFGDPISCTQLTVAPPRKAPQSDWGKASDRSRTCGTDPAC